MLFKYFEIQWTPDNSNLQGKEKKILSYREFELSRVKLYRKCSEEKYKLVRVSGRFELPGVDCVYSRERIETKCTFVMQVFETKKNAKFAKVDARFPRIVSLHNRTTDTENACV